MYPKIDRSGRQPDMEFLIEGWLISDNGNKSEQIYEQSITGSRGDACQKINDLLVAEREGLDRRVRFLFRPNPEG